MLKKLMELLVKKPKPETRSASGTSPSSQFDDEWRATFSTLSAGDISCLYSIAHGEADMQQMTTKGSAHNNIYLLMEKRGWAEKAELPEAMQKLDFAVAWRLTDEGRQHLRTKPKEPTT